MNTTLSPIDLEKLCNLAALDISLMSFEARDQLVAQLQDMIALAQKVQNVSTDDLKPLYHPCELSQPLRKDSIEDTPIDAFREKLLHNAPNHDDTNYLVPKIIE